MRYPVYDPPVGIVTLAGWVRGYVVIRYIVARFGRGEKGNVEEWRSATGDQEAGIGERESKSEIRKTKREARRGDCAAIPPSRRSARDAQIALRGPTRQNAARRAKMRRGGKGRAAPVGMTDLGRGWSRVGMTIRGENDKRDSSPRRSVRGAKAALRRLRSE